MPKALNARQRLKTSVYYQMPQPLPCSLIWLHDWAAWRISLVSASSWEELSSSTVSIGSFWGNLVALIFTCHKKASCLWTFFCIYLLSTPLHERCKGFLQVPGIQEEFSPLLYFVFGLNVFKHFSRCRSTLSFLFYVLEELSLYTLNTTSFVQHHDL